MALAQKLSIRLNQYYPETKLFQVKTSMLFSRWFSESARKVDELFTTIEKLCQANRNHLMCIVIDEVESIAGSRSAGSQHGGSQDNLRATNALLTGFDRLKVQPNVIILATSNMIKCLDTAFVDRCGLVLEIGPPSPVHQYQILRNSVLELIERKIIRMDTTTVSLRHVIPSHTEATLYDVPDSFDDPGTKLLRIVELLNMSAAQAGKEKPSGRFLIQLPELATMQYIRSHQCSVADALEYIKRFVLAQRIEELAG